MRDVTKIGPEILGFVAVQEWRWRAAN